MVITRDEAPYFIEFDDPSVKIVQEMLMTERLGTILHEPYWVPQLPTTIPYRTIPELIAEFESLQSRRFRVISFDPEQAKRILKEVPLANALSASVFRVSMFLTPPNFTWTPHKDGKDLKVGVNYPLYIKDSGCTTHWYSDELDELEVFIRENAGVTRELVGFEAEKHKPVHSFTMQPDKAVLFNTDVYHNFENHSPHWRVIMTLRSMISTVDFNTMAARVRKRAK